MAERVLYLLHLPPPIHGSSVVGKQIKESERINSSWKASFVNIGTSSSVDAIGKFNARKIIVYFRVLFQVLYQLLFHRPRWTYVALTVQGTAFYKDALVVLLIKFFRIPIVFHLHNKGISSCQDRLPYKCLYPMVFHNSRVILLSKYLYPDISRFVSQENVSYCPNGLPDAMEKRDFSNDHERVPCILFLSNLIASKGVMDLIEACGLLKARGVAFRCKLVGGEGDIRGSEIIDRCKQLGIDNEVTYEGKLYGKDKDGVFANSSIFCLPTFYHYECLPLVLIEAMQWQLPIVSTAEGGIPDLVRDGETGFISTRNDPEGLADRLERLLCDRTLRQKMGNAGREHYLSHFTDRRFETTMRSLLEHTFPGK